MAFMFFPSINAIVARLEERQRIRDGQRRAVEQSARNFKIGLERGRTTVDKLTALLQFKDVVGRLQLPDSLTEPLGKLFEQLEDYAVDLADGLTSAEHASQFRTEESWQRSHFTSQTFQPGTLTERFHCGATKRLEAACHEVEVALEWHFDKCGAVNNDEATFIFQFREFAHTLDQTMRELQ